MRVLITGANGMLGKDVAALLRERGGYALLETDREMLDITNRDAVIRFVQEHKPQLIINTAAYNFVDAIEEDKAFEIAMKVNGHGPGYLAEAAKQIGAKFVHYSTDYVFSGEKEEGYVESDTVQPISRYGETKVAGEQAVQNAGGDYYICRTSKIFGEPGRSDASKESFVNLMLRLVESLPELTIVHEEVGSPTYTPDLAKMTLDLIQGNYEPGIYHLVNDGKGVTWYEFAEEIFALCGIETPRKPVPSSAFPKPAMRPKYAALINTKMPPIRHRKEALAEFLKNYRVSGRE